ncbi:MAG: pyridoxal phosphate-dependent aminotransferase [Deltaproteobacteria bacterium]|nr:pyridoxal phosphate-dependent aminotransferase [Deltaproteobacteria bacterium]MDO9212179.1 pyridoxal phosphate-dependent aminotransferase [Deltaproteobacteria bacterium]
MSIAVKIRDYMERASWIRKMFEQGLELKSKLGADKVFDFSLGNPNLEPPDEVRKAILGVISDERPGKHAYMPNAGLRETRQAVANSLSKDHGMKITWEQVIMTCGAGGGLNVALKTILDPGDEVLVLSPYFVEYLFYIDNHNGIGQLIKNNEDFTLDIGAIEAGVTPRTKAIIINSPNNPSGRIYDESSLKNLGKLFENVKKRSGQTIYLLSDEPYSKLVYDGARVPSVFQAYPYSMVITSYSKDLSLPGERIGYVVVNPRMENWKQVVDGLTFCNRILGFVNAPALMQHIISKLQGVQVDVSEYQRKRDNLCRGLAEAGYSFIKPEGAFYLFPKSPIPDDVLFVNTLLQENILAVPGTGFGTPGYFRLAYCVEDRVIEGAMEGFRRAIRKFSR